MDESHNSNFCHIFFYIYSCNFYSNFQTWVIKISWIFFAPSGVPKAMLILLVPIEIISYLSRPISLSVRLFANMMAGHTLLKVIGGFVFVLGANSFIIGGALPVAFLIALTGLEIVIAFLQAYVFAILTCLYINDAIHLH